MTGAYTINDFQIKRWLNSHATDAEVENELLQLGCDVAFIEANIEALKKARLAKRQFAAFILLGVGAVFGFISCVLSVLNPYPDLFDFFLYGLTPVAVLIIFTGLYLLFE